jgi:hypothetical protein
MVNIIETAFHIRNVRSLVPFPMNSLTTYPSFHGENHAKKLLYTWSRVYGFGDEVSIFRYSISARNPAPLGLQA